jgi:hypothetical protein
MLPNTLVSKRHPRGIQFSVRLFGLQGSARPPTTVQIRSIADKALRGHWMHPPKWHGPWLLSVPGRSVGRAPSPSSFRSKLPASQKFNGPMGFLKITMRGSLSTTMPASHQFPHPNNGLARLHCIAVVHFSTFPRCNCQSTSCIGSRHAPGSVKPSPGWGKLVSARDRAAILVTEDRLVQSSQSTGQ